MEVVAPVSSPGDFSMGSIRFGDFRYFSAPTSPTGAAAIYHDFNSHSLNNDDHELAPKSLRTATAADDDDTSSTMDEEADFAFDFSGQLDRSYLAAAEELFEEGKIRPLKLPPRLQAEELPHLRSASSPKSPKGMFRDAFSPRAKAKKDFGPLEAATDKARRGSVRERGRDRKPSSSDDNAAGRAARRSARSLSPFRISDIVWCETEPDHHAKPAPSKPDSSAPGLPSSPSKKWRLKDFLLFRSASEGRAVTTGKDPLRKYSGVAKTKAEDVRNASFRSAHSSSGSGSGSRSGGRSGPAMSAHELHYKTNRAVSDELKRKTYLPYRQGLLGWFRN